MSSFLASGDDDLRDLIKFSALTGCRPGEVWAMQVRDVDTECGLWTVEKSKTRKRGEAAQKRPLIDDANARGTANAAAKAVAWGFERVYYFPDGIDGWKHAEHPVE